MKNKILRRIGIIAIVLSLVLSMTVNVSAQSAILKVVKEKGDDVTQLFSNDTEDKSYMNLSITGVDTTTNTVTVTLKISNVEGTANPVSLPEFNISMPTEFSQYFDVTFTQDNGWTLTNESNTTGTEASGANFKYKSTETWDNTESAYAEFIYTIKLKDGVNADDLVGNTYYVAKELHPNYEEATGLYPGDKQVYGPSNEECAIPSFTFEKQEENKKTGLASNITFIALGAVGLSLIVVSLSKKGKMTRI